MEDVRIDPWNSDQSTDYDLLAEKFGLDSIDMSKIQNPSILHTRGLVFAQRDMDVVLQAAKRNTPFGVLTGLMPSGRMHLGHTMVIEQAKWYQSHGADVSVAVADLESLATREVSLDKGRKIALEQYVSNYAAMGLDPDKTQVYFQSTRPEVQRLGFRLGRRTNLSELGAIYGFEGDTNLAHVQAPLVQVGDIVHPMLNEYNGAITFFLQMNVLSGAEDIADWITDRSVRATYDFEEEKTRRFEWFLSADKAKATLIEVFDDSDGALTRVQNLMSSPIAPEWMDRFEIDSLTVLGDVSDDLQEALASMAPDVRTFAGGFTKDW